MKRLALFLIVALSLTGTAWAQQAGLTPPPTHNPAPGAQPAGASRFTLTQDEMQELRAARSAALQANPDLITEHNKLLERMNALEDKVDAAMIKADPTIAPIIAKFEAKHPHPGAPAGSPPANPPPTK